MVNVQRPSWGLGLYIDKICKWNASAQLDRLREVGPAGQMIGASAQRFWVGCLWASPSRADALGICPAGLGLSVSGRWADALGICPAGLSSLAASSCELVVVLEWTFGQFAGCGSARLRFCLQVSSLGRFAAVRMFRVLIHGGVGGPRGPGGLRRKGCFERWSGVRLMRFLRPWLKGGFKIIHTSHIQHSHLMFAPLCAFPNSVCEGEISKPLL